jgi:hypothetical protein
LGLKNSLSKIKLLQYLLCAEQVQLESNYHLPSKKRWSKLFAKDIKTALICSESDIMLNESKAARNMTKAKLKQHGI